MPSFSKVSVVAVIGVLAIGCSGSTGPKQVATPAAIISIDTGTALPGGIVPISLRLTRPEGDGPKLDSLAVFEFMICYDADAFRFISADRGPGISNWEYFTYRTRTAEPLTSAGLANVQVVAVRDLNNGRPPDASQCFPSGILATLRFFASGEMEYRGTTARIGFSIQGCKDNTLTAVGYGKLYVPDTSLGQILYRDGYDTIPCSNLTRSAVLELRGGSILIDNPTRPLRGDVDLNGIAFQIHDAVLFSNYFKAGYAVFDPERASEQIAATDCDGDGEPLTRADLGVMIRDVTGEDPIGDSLDAPYTDTLLIRPRREGDRWILSCESTIQLDELWFRVVEPGSRELLVHHPGDPPSVVSLSGADGRFQVACGTVDGKQIFGPELGDRFEIQGYHGNWFIVAAQASRYPGVSMRVRILQ